MPEITYQGTRYTCLTDESVLDTLLRNGIEVANSCRAGACHICLMHCVNGQVTEDSQQDLKSTQKSLNHFLSCQCVPEQDIEVALPDDEDIYISARLVEKQQLSPLVWRLRFETAVPMYYHSGQFINLKNDSGWIRSYSLASLPTEDEFLEIQVRNVPDGKMSNWLVTDFSIGMHIDVEGPNGHCFYTDGPDHSMLMIGTGTGLAPLFGILRDTLHQGHCGPIHLYHGAFCPEELYLHNTLTNMAKSHSNFFYHGCVSDEKPTEEMKNGYAPDIALLEHPKLRDWKVFLCGPPELVQKTSKMAFLAGANMKDIASDAFTSPEIEN